MEATNDALKLLAQALDILNETDFTDSRDNLTQASEACINLLEKAIEKLTVKRST